MTSRRRFLFHVDGVYFLFHRCHGYLKEVPQPIDIGLRIAHHLALYDDGITLTCFARARFAHEHWLLRVPNNGNSLLERQL